jgi:glycosyltransferase involved in cell wall biosynthesis
MVFSSERASSLVSVIVPAFNACGLIRETLDSVLAQTYRPIEAIVVDDGSTDGTHREIDAWAHTSVIDSGLALRRLRTDNHGAASARNKGFALSTGEFIQFLDADDLLHPTKIAIQVEHSRACGKTVYGNSRRFATGANGILIYPVLAVNRPERALKDWFEGRFISPHSFLWKRMDVQSNGPWDERVSLDDDGEYACRFLLNGGTFEYFGDAWVYYRIYQDMRPRLSTLNSVKALGAVLDVLCSTEKKLREKQIFDEYRESFACQFWSLARQAAYVPEIRNRAIAEYRRLATKRQLPERLADRLLYGLLGISGRKRLVTFMRRRFGLQPFRLEATVDSIKDLYNFDMYGQ